MVLVTGGSGFIGSYLMKELPPDTINLDIKNGNDILECDLPPADVVIHLAAEPGVVASVEDPYSNARTNILGTIRLAEHYKDSKIIFASSGGTIQETIESPYGLSKKTCEEYLKLLTNNCVILRFPNVYGEGSRSVVDKFLRGDTDTIYGDGNSFRIYGHVSDVVRGIQQAVNWNPGTYSLGSDQRYSALELVKTMGISYRFAPERQGEITNLNSQLPNRTPDWQPEVDIMEYIHNAISNHS